MEGEEVTLWFKVSNVFITASVKFLAAPFLAEVQKLTFLQSFITTTVGGITGILLFAFVGQKIASWWRHLTALIKSIFIRRPAEVIERKPRRKFTRMNRFIVRIKKRFGLFGIAFVTPCIISIPIGTLVAISIFKNKKQVLVYLLVSLVLWSVVLNLAAFYLGLSHLFKS